ncbi:MAG: hypothetical protein ACP5D7_05995 [Limnospira sp.]
MLTDQIQFQKLRDRRVKSHTIWIVLFNLTVLSLTILRAVLRDKTPIEYFEETGIITWFSGIQLLVLSGLAWRIARIRKQAGIEGKKAPQNLWKWIAFGFVYLTVDEMAQIHEAIDFFIHYLFDMETTRLSDSIDDIIVIFYSLIGFYILYNFRDEFKKYLGVFYLFAIAFLLKGIMVAFDIYTNDEEVLSDWFADPEQAKRTLEWLRTIEDCFKILAEAVFIGAFVGCTAIARQITPGDRTP